MRLKIQCTDVSHIWHVHHLDPQACHPISSVGPSISSVTFDIEECSIDIDVLHLRYRMSISKVLDMEGHIIRYRRLQTFDIEGREYGCRN
jgi:hypothetical protein